MTLGEITTAGLKRKLSEWYCSAIPAKYRAAFKRFKTQHLPDTFTYTFTYTHIHTYTLNYAKQRNNVNNRVVGRHQRRITSNATKAFAVLTVNFPLACTQLTPNFSLTSHSTHNTAVSTVVATFLNNHFFVVVFAH